MLDLKFLQDQPWLAEERRLELLVQQAARVREWPTARQVARVRLKRLEEARHVAAKAVRAVKGKVGVIPMHGPVEQRLSCAGFMLGGCSCEEISVQLDVMLNDKSVEAIVLHTDSPGGSSYGVEELSDKIHAARGRKTIYAIADSMACSAAYWLATSAEQMFCTPGGDVGSVGVYVMHVDQSKAADAAGVKVSFVHAAKYKVEGHPFEPLGDEARGWLQEQVDYTYSKFVDALKRNRSVTRDEVRSKFGQGRVMNPTQALDAKMIDRVMSFEELMGKLTGKQSGGQGRAASAEVLRLQHELAKERDYGTAG